MGNILRRLCSDTSHGEPRPEAPPLGHHGVSVDAVGYVALARDLFQFEINGQLPVGLGKHVQSSTAAQAKWFRKLLTAWKVAQPPPRNAREASVLVIQTLKDNLKVDVEGLLSFYGLPLSPSTSAAPSEAPHSQTLTRPRPWQEGVVYELCTLPVDSYAAVDGDSLIVHVDISKDAKELAAVPQTVHEAIANRRLARQQRDYHTADALQKQIKTAGYKVMDPRNGSKEVLARKYRVRLRGVDAPENSMPFGQEAKVMLQSLVDGQPLYLQVYDTDQYGRIVADVYSQRGFIQEILLKNGGCWHYVAYDKRQEFAKWEADARSKRLGLWESNNPEKPWDYRKLHPRI